MKFKTPKFFVLAQVIASVVFPALLHAQNPALTEKKLTIKEWNEDIDTYISESKRLHKNLFHDLTPAELTAATDKLRKDIPNLTYDQIVIRFAQIAALDQDGHSGFSDGNTENLPLLPVKFVQYADGVYIRAASPQYKDIAGGKVIKVGNTGIDEAIERIGSVIPHEPGNTGYRQAWSARKGLNNPWLLHALGLSASKDSASFLIENQGKQFRIAAKAEKATNPWFLNNVPDGWVDARAKELPIPLAYQHDDQAYWFKYIPEKQAVYFQFNIVFSMGPVNLRTFSDSLGRFIEEHQVNRLVLDLRNNTGGDNTQLRPLLTMLYRSRINHRGGLYLIIGKTTFSAAQNFVDRVENYAEPIFVGEPTSQNVNFYGDARVFDLPHSHLQFAVSSLWWQDKDPRDQRKATSPELAISSTFEDYKNGRDPVLDLALNGEIPKTLEEVLDATTLADKKAILNAAQNYINDPVHQYDRNVEQRLNTYGYKVLGSHKIKEAVNIFELNTILYPNSFNAFDSYGEALLIDHRNQDALTAYKRSLQLNPENANAAQVIKKLQSS